jgi:hypothetical protein
MAKTKEHNERGSAYKSAYAVLRTFELLVSDGRWGRAHRPLRQLGLDILKYLFIFPPRDAVSDPQVGIQCI